MTLEVIATCGYPAEVKGQRVRDVSVFTSCPESSSPPDQKVVVASISPKLKKKKPNLSKALGSKARPAKAKAIKAKVLKSNKKPLSPKVTKNKMTV